ncbi:UPF0160 protein MYG1, mitochondrial isoform X2 [Mycetomoellerius zeteki]|uniref:UPF0160 protein MYG1, mitochondrial isoform X2 n=1 Tax=Mycetomoellerius zeteki TaxID=64791 RepID=UPI00084EBE05|nr:PREDICTED: UPF0160 protein MYG1, mitochondrial isoform X2 [Trachymyrmex zeteki]
MIRVFSRLQRNARSGEFSKFFTWRETCLFDFTLRTMSSKSTVRIGTHDGTFHCDEVLACALLKLLPQYKDASIVRSRSQNVLDTCDIVVDVGGEYDPSKHRYDHHMREFQESMSTVMKKPGYDWTIRLSSAGLIYCHFGHEILRSILSDITEDRIIDEIFKKIYDTLIKEIDGIDNGIPMYDAEPLYRIVTDLSARVSRLNSQWNSQNVDIEKQFEKAMALVLEEFLEFVQYSKNVWLPARDLVRRAVESRFEVDPSGEIIVLSQAVPWKEHLFQLEKDMNVSPSIKMFLPAAWGGLRADALVEACGIEGAIFVHSVRFIGGHKTKDGAVAMARKALEIGKAE